MAFDLKAHEKEMELRKKVARGIRSHVADWGMTVEELSDALDNRNGDAPSIRAGQCAAQLITLLMMAEEN